MTLVTLMLLHDYADMQIDIIVDNARIPPLSPSTYLADQLPPLSPWRNRRRYGGRSARRPSFNRNRCRWSSDSPASPLAIQKSLSRPARCGENFPCCSPTLHSGLSGCSSSPSPTPSCFTSCAPKRDLKPRIPCRSSSSIDDQRAGSVCAQIFNIPTMPCI